MTMRDAEEDEETRVLGAREAAPALLLGERARQPGLPGPRIPRPAPHDLKDAGEDEATKLKGAGLSRPPPWLVSEGPNAPRELDHEQLTQEIKAGKLSRDAFAWRDGMKQWQSVADIPSLAGLLGKPASQSPPSSSPRASALLRLGPLVPTTEGSAEAGKVLLSSSVSTADFSNVERPLPSSGSGSAALDKTPPGGSVPPRAPPARPAPISSPLAGPIVRPAPAQVVEAEADAQLEAAEQTADRASPVPRPAAGRPPLPNEPVAKADPNKATPRTPAIVIADEVAQHILDPKIAQREVTQPARARLTLAQLRAGSQRQSVLLWVLGAGGWAVAGVLAGILIARGGESAPEPTATPEPPMTSTPAGAVPRAVPPPATPAPEPPRAGAEAEVVRADELAVAAPPAVLPPKPKTVISSNLALPQAPRAPNPTAPPAAPAAEPPPTPSPENAINSPGF